MSDARPIGYELKTAPPGAVANAIEQKTHGIEACAAVEFGLLNVLRRLATIEANAKTVPLPEPVPTIEEALRESTWRMQNCLASLDPISRAPERAAIERQIATNRAALRAMGALV